MLSGRLLRPGKRAFLWALALLVCGAHAQPAPSPAADAEPGWHVVLPGENLHLIAAQVLGDRSQWPLLWRLNPEIRDPNRLTPGQRIRVPGRSAPELDFEAELSRVAQRVEEQPHPQPFWGPAKLGDKLRERDGLRTHERASAELTFKDGARYRVNERSLLFLRAPSRTGAARQARAIEVLQGEADVGLQPRPGAGAAREVEIVIGATSSRARPTAEEAATARARQDRSGAAQLMIYGGAGEMSARGVTVEVPRGMGTATPKGGAPMTPEALLPAPQPQGPTAHASFDHANPVFTWQPVAAAASYTLEVCRDSGCGELVERVTGISSPRLAHDGLPVGRFYWRVCAVSRAGLDGYASAAVPFEVRSLWRRPAQR